MMWKKVLLATCTMALLGPLSALAVPPDTALDGYCPVCLVKMDKLVKGDARFSSVYDGKTYLFPSAEQKRMFDANPTAFVPALRGDCVVCQVEMGKRVAGKPEFHTVKQGRLFLFPSEKQKKMFEGSPEKYMDTDLALGGNCPVCLVKMNQVVGGRAEYVSVYDSQRYLFPSPKQKRVFDDNPAAFAPALGGRCTVCKVEENKDVAGVSEYYLTHKGRLYLFPSAKQRNMFRTNPSKYADADVALNGYCPVCKVETGKDVKGAPEFAIDYQGKRYLFPGQKQLEMFRNNPTKYVTE